VCLTGGEPTFQWPGLLELFKEIRDADLSAYMAREDLEDPNDGFKSTFDTPNRLITMETNGAIFVEEMVTDHVFISCSPKFLGGSTIAIGNSISASEAARRIKAHGESDVKAWIESEVPMQLKFVVENHAMFEQIFDWVCRMVDRKRRRTMPLVFQPEWFKGKAEFKSILEKYSDPLQYQKLADEGFKSVTFQPQSHKLLSVR
jgi:organic radical activating enzyme